MSKYNTLEKNRSWCAEQFKKALKDLGLEQAELAKILKVSRATICYWENERHSIPSECWFYLAGLNKESLSKLKKEKTK